MNTLDVLAIGSLVRDNGIIKEAHSTSTLIRAGGVNIVVDTSTPEMLPSVRTSFMQLGILPKDVDIVVLTHTHDDHCGNNGIFRKAKFYVREEESFVDDRYIAVSSDIDIAPGVRLVHTPGHTDGSMSVLVEGDRRYAIAGDAIPLEDNFIRMLPPGICSNAEKAMESIKSLTEYADVIVPGHGPPFFRDAGRMR
ncbi:MAG: MBL fold metallo-hydrolase [Methanomassiliicoccaceae archaeon]|nr:MBL fold metallo-hydrolase [Methanomassiliicoccaceae archaeon]